MIALGMQESSQFNKVFTIINLSTISIVVVSGLFLSTYQFEIMFPRVDLKFVDKIVLSLMYCSRLTTKCVTYLLSELPTYQNITKVSIV